MKRWAMQKLEGPQMMEQPEPQGPYEVAEGGQHGSTGYSPAQPTFHQ